MDPLLLGAAVAIVTILVLFSGVSVALGLLIVSAGFLIIFDGIRSLELMPEILFGKLDNFALLSIPMFIIMGASIASTRAGADLYEALERWLTRIPGGLVISNLGACALFAAMSGSSPATCAAIGKMGIPEMRKRGYPDGVAAGSIAAGGTLGILIPPSIMLIVMGPVLEVPVTDLFRAAIVPGILLALLYMIYALGRCMINPSLGPILSVEDQPETSPYYLLEVAAVMASLVVFFWLITAGASGSLAFFPLGGLIIPVAWLGFMFFMYKWARKHKPGGFYFSDLWYEFFMGLVPPTVLIAFALGSILAGWATPAEAAACGAFGSILLSLAYRKLTFAKFYDALIKTLEISVLIMFLVAASNFFGAVFSNLGTPKFLTELLLSFDLSTAAMLIFVMALVFLLGWPLEWVPIVLIIVPILVPLLVDLNVNLTWFAILVAVNLQTAWLSPPVALSAYFLKGVVPEWDLKDIYLGMMQFMVIQMIGLSLIVLFPGFALWLPDWLSAAGSPGFFSYAGYGK